MLLPENSGGLDLIFLDIELLDLDGIVVGRYIREELENRDIQIVYISCKGQYAQQLFKMQPMDFLVKPILQKQIDETMELAIKIIDKNNMFLNFRKAVSTIRFLMAISCIFTVPEEKYILCLKIGK